MVFWHTSIWAIICLVASVGYNIFSDGNYGVANYMYMLIPEHGTPLEILYGLVNPISIGGVSVDLAYVGLLTLTGLAIIVIFHFLHQALRKVFRCKTVD